MDIVPAPFSPTTIANHVRTSWNVLKLQRLDLLGWVFERLYSLVSYIFFVRFQVLSPSYDISFCWWFVGRIVPEICLLLQNWNALWVKLRAFVSSFWAKFRLFLIFHWHRTFFAPTGINCASVSDIKSMNSLWKLHGPSPNVLWHSFVWITEDELARKLTLFLFLWKKIYSRKKETVAKSFLSFFGLMIANIWKITSVEHRKFKSAQSGDNSKVSWSERMAFFRK